MSASTTQAINFAIKLALFDDRWQPRVIVQMNDYQFKLMKIESDFVRHSHADTDEAFIALAGRLRIDLRDGAVHLGPGEMYVVPRGAEYKPFAESEVHMLLVRPRGVRNTGDQGGERTIVNDLWI